MIAHIFLSLRDRSPSAYLPLDAQRTPGCSTSIARHCLKTATVLPEGFTQPTNMSGGFEVGGRTALVTGAARGFGREFAERLLRAGAKVIGKRVFSLFSSMFQLYIISGLHN